VAKLGRNVGLDVGIDNLPSARVHLLELEVLVGARRYRLKPRGLGSNYVAEKVSADKVNNRTSEIRDS
jgi:hypothetical protein